MLKACVIGWPIKHSRSPLIHGHWLKHYNIDGTYDKRAVPPDQLATFLASFEEQGLAGCNVTVPHKENVFHSVAVTDPLTRILGAVNTVFVRDGELFGLNTDGMGFITHLRKSAPAWKPQTGAAVVLGAGGASQAVVAALVEAGVPEVRLVNRTLERAERLANKFRHKTTVTTHAWEVASDVLADADLLVNTTTLGMAGSTSMELQLDRLPQTATVYDIVYVPLETELLRRAKDRGNTVVDGLGMLLHQAVPGFELWFGVRPEVTPHLHSLIVADIEAHS